MTTRACATLLLSIAVAGSLTVGCDPSRSPGVRYDVDPDSVRQLLRVQWTGDPVFAGHAFLLARPEGPVIVTSAGVARRVDADGDTDPEAPLTGGLLVNPVDDYSVRVGDRLSVSGSPVFDRRDPQHGIAAFRVVDWDSTRAFPIAATGPEVGDTVWVMSLRPASGGGPGRHAAIVQIAEDSGMIYSYIGSTTGFVAAGAAVLDRNAHVVGVDLATGSATARDWVRLRSAFPGCCPEVVGGEAIGLAASWLVLQQHLPSPTIPQTFPPGARTP